MSKQGGVNTNLSSDAVSGVDVRRIIEANQKQFSEEDLLRFDNYGKKQEEYKLESYNKWLESKRYETFKAKPIIEDYVIIEVFHYNVLATTSLLLSDDPSNVTKEFSDYRIIPVARVLASNSEKVSKGDLVSIPAIFSKTVRSNEWLQWKKDVTEQPSLKHEYPEPPVYVGKLNEWVNYIYQENPLEELNTLDQHTFCIPARMLQALEQ